MKVISDISTINNLQTVIISRSNSLVNIKLYEPIVLKFKSRFTILEFVGFSKNSSGDTCLAHPRIVSSLLGNSLEGQIEVEQLLNNQKYIDYHILNYTPTSVCIKFIDSGDVYKFLDRIQSFENKSIFKKKDNFFSQLIKSKLIGKYIMNGQTSFIECMGIHYPILINVEGEIEKQVYYCVTNDFNFTINGEDFNFEFDDHKNPKEQQYRNDTLQFIQEISLNTLGGVTEQLEGIFSILDTLFFKTTKVLHTHLPKTILIWGLQGTGKSTILSSIGKEFERRGIAVRFGSGTSFNMDLFQNLNLVNGTLICLDDIENLGKNMGHLFSALQNIAFNSGKCAILAVSNKNIEEMEASIRQSGHFERDFYIPIPSSLKNKRDVLNVHFNRYFSSLTLDKRREFLNNLQRFVSGYVGRDIERIFKMTQYHMMLTRQDSTFISEPCWEDFDYALRVVKPSQLHTENLFTILKASDRETDCTFSEIGGYSEVKQRCKELLYWPLDHPDSFHRFGLPTCCGILLHGPSGVGKTLLVKSLASMGKMNYISIKCPEVFSQYVGETEKLIRYIFKRAKQLSPCVLVFDEIDALTPRRELQNNTTVTDSGSSARALSQLLNEMDGISNRKEVFIVGCTNRIELIDQAILRPGRLDQILYMHMPEEEDLLEIFEINRTKMPFSSSVDIARLVSMIKDRNWTGASISGWCREAALESLRENIANKEIEMKHFLNALDLIK